jgi:hypothetical protein
MFAAEFLDCIQPLGDRRRHLRAPRLVEVSTRRFLTRRSIIASDAHSGRRNLWLRTLDRAGLGFNS